MDLVASTGVARERRGEGINGRRPILEYADRAVGILECPSMHRPGKEGVASKLPVGRPIEPAKDIERQSVRQAEESRKLPTSNDGLESAVRVAGQRPSFSERKFRDPVRIELVFRVIVGNTAQCLWIPGVDDLPAEAAPSTDSGGVGRDIDGFGEGVIEVKLQTARHRVPKAQLQRVIAGIRVR